MSPRSSSIPTRASSPSTATTLPPVLVVPAPLVGGRVLLHVGRRGGAVVVGGHLGDVVVRVEVHDHLVGPVAADIDLVAGVRPGPLELHVPAPVPHGHDSPGAG